MQEIKKIEDIYPITIVGMRHGCFAIIQAYSDADFVFSLQENEEWQYEPDYYMDKHWPHINYGIGKDIYSAFISFQKKYNSDK